MINSLVKDIERFFPNLVGLSLRNKNLNKISAEGLKQFPNLLLFKTYRNPLVSLDGDLFKYTTKLRSIWIHSSQLQHVGQNFLTDLDDLSFAYFRNNPCIDISASTNETIEALKRELLISCPPLISTTEATTSKLPISTT